MAGCFAGSGKHTKDAKEENMSQSVAGISQGAEDVRVRIFLKKHGGEDCVDAVCGAAGWDDAF